MGNIEKLKAELKRDEGFSRHAYRDSQGYWTIGYGRLIDERVGGGLTENEAEFLLVQDIWRTLDEVSRFEWFGRLNETRQRVVLNMAFNLGLYRFQGFKKMIAALERGDWMNAAREMRNSKWALQVGPRADRLIELMKNGEG